MSASAPLDWNAVRFDPARRQDHVESFFIKLNDPKGERALWLKATIFARASEPERPMAEGWAIAFDRRSGTTRHVAVKHELPFHQASFNRNALGIHWDIPACRPLRAGAERAGAERAGAERAGAEQGASIPNDSLSIEPGSTWGTISAHGRRIAWSLRFLGPLRSVAPLPFDWMYSPKFPSSKIVTPYPDLRFEGEVLVDGEAWAIDGWRGMQGHNWGRRHTDFYAWSHINVWDQDEDFVFEGLSAKVQLGPLQTPLLTLISVRKNGVVFDFNEPGVIAKAQAQADFRSWSFSSRSRDARIEGRLVADTADMVGLYYANPNGPMTYCLNSKLARAEIRFEAQGRPAIALSSKAAALEIGTHDEGHGVTMAV